MKPLMWFFLMSKVEHLLVIEHMKKRSLALMLSSLVTKKNVGWLTKWLSSSQSITVVFVLAQSSILSNSLKQYFLGVTEIVKQAQVLGFFTFWPCRGGLFLR